MQIFKKKKINKERRKINLRKILIKKRHSRRRKVISLCELNRRITILNQTETNLLRRLFIENVKISNIIKDFANVYNIKKR